MTAIHRNIITDSENQNENQYTKKIIAKNLRMSRQAMLCSQASAAKLVDLSLSQYKKYEAAEELMRADTALKWSTIYGISAFQLLAGHKRYETLTLKTAVLDISTLRLWLLAKSLNANYFNYLLLTLSNYSTKPKHCQSHDCVYPRDGKQLAMGEVHTLAYSSIAKHLRLTRLHRKLSQEEMADKLSMNCDTYRRYENERNTPRFSLLFLARVAIQQSQIFEHLPQYGKLLHYYQQRLSLINYYYNKVPHKIKHNLYLLLEGFEKMALANNAIINDTVIKRPHYE